MIASRLFAPSSKLATTRAGQTTTLPEQLHIEDATEDDLYAAMDWLVDRQTVIEKKLAAFGPDLVVLIGDRGMVTQTQINAFIEQEGVEWITALKSGAIRKLKVEGSLHLGLFDERNLFELTSPKDPGERLVACRNPELAVHRAKKREELVAATKAEIEKVQRMVQQNRPHDRADIGLCVGKVINKYKVAKHLKLEIGDGVLRHRVPHDKVAAEATLDGIYVIRTSVPRDVMSPEETVRHYTWLTWVERAFRSMKTVSLKVRPIFHWSEQRVRAHIFLCMLAYYVEWHMRRAWSS